MRHDMPVTVAKQFVATWRRLMLMPSIYNYLIPLADLLLNVHDQPYRSNMYMASISPVEHAIPPAVHLRTMRLTVRYLYTRHIVLLLNFGFRRFASLSAHGTVRQM